MNTRNRVCKRKPNHLRYSFIESDSSESWKKNKRKHFLLWGHCRCRRPCKKQFREILCALHPVSPKESNFHNYATISQPGKVCWYNPLLLLRAHQFFMHSCVCVFCFMQFYHSDFYDDRSKGHRTISSQGFLGLPFIRHTHHPLHFTPKTWQLLICSPSL